MNCTRICRKKNDIRSDSEIYDNYGSDDAIQSLDQLLATVTTKPVSQRNQTQRRSFLPLRTHGSMLGNNFIVLNDAYKRFNLTKNRQQTSPEYIDNY